MEGLIIACEEFALGVDGFGAGASVFKVADGVHEGAGDEVKVAVFIEVDKVG